MLSAVLKWAPGLLAIFVLGPIAGVLVGSLRGVDGGPDASLLVNASPVTGLMAGLGILVIAALTGIVSGRLVGFRIGTWAVGYVLAWASYLATDVPNLLRSQPMDAGAPWGVLAVEGLLCGLAAVALYLAMLFTSRDEHKPETKELIAQARHPSSLAGAAAAIVGGAVAAFLVNMDPIKGQAIFAAVIAGLAAGALGSYAGSFFGQVPRQEALCLGFASLAVLSPIAGLIAHGNDALTAANAGTLLGPSAMLGLDWAAGLFMGLPAGVALVESAVAQGSKAPA